MLPFSQLKASKQKLKNPNSSFSLKSFMKPEMVSQSSRAGRANCRLVHLCLEALNLPFVPRSFATQNNVRNSIDISITYNSSLLIISVFETTSGFANFVIPKTKIVETATNVWTPSIVLKSKKKTLRRTDAYSDFIIVALSVLQLLFVLN